MLKGFLQTCIVIRLRRSHNAFFPDTAETMKSLQSLIDAEEVALQSLDNDHWSNIFNNKVNKYWRSIEILESQKLGSMRFDEGEHPIPYPKKTDPIVRVELLLIANLLGLVLSPIKDNAFKRVGYFIVLTDIVGLLESSKPQTLTIE